MAAAVALFPAAASAADPHSQFWGTWGDGKAELDGYTLTQPRYGESRDGKAVMIFVTEDHSVSEQVKIEGDTYKIPAKDKYTVLKLNFVRNFQTGIYTYHILSSVFCRIDDKFYPSKISVSIQEWCGHVYHQLVIDRRRAVESLHSYFGGEADQTHVHRIRDNVLFEDAIPVLVRELDGPWLAPGQTLEASCGPSLLGLRLLHKPFEWKTIKVTKGAKRNVMGSVLGKVAVTRWTVETPDQGIYTYSVEVDWPHRIIQWSSDQGESGVLTGSTRLPYWKLHKAGDEKYLKDLGWLSP